MQSLSQLEASAIKQPNSIEINQALAEAYAKEENWEVAVKAYQKVVALYPATAALNVNRIRLGAIALGISSLLFLAAEILRPATIWVASPYTTPGHTYMSSPALAVSNILFLPILILLSCAAISVYKLLSASSDNRLAFWGMVSIIIGAGLFLPIFGINAVVLPAAGQWYFPEGDALGFYIYDLALSQPLAVVFKLGGYLLFLGLTIFNVVIWKSGYLPKWASTLLWIGWSLFIRGKELSSNLVDEPHISNPMLFTLLVVIGGIGLARGVWQQAPLQFKPTTDSAQKADS